MRQLTIVVVTFSSVFILFLLGLYNHYNLERKTYSARKVYADIGETVTVDYKATQSNGSPLIFGGVHGPNPYDVESWDLLDKSGVTSLRHDFFIEDDLPTNTTLNDYINNKNNIKDVKNWNITNIERTNNFYKSAKTRGIKVIGIISYIPEWLGYNGRFSYPKNLDVYKDIVKKIYRIHRENLDYVEVWNEPDYDYFFNINGIGKKREKAYSDIFIVTAEAIREVDAEANDGKIVPILGPAISKPESVYLLKELLNTKAKDYLGGVTIHQYGSNNPIWEDYKKLLQSYGTELPIFIDEWNISSDYIKNPTIYSYKGITYTAKKLLAYLKSGIMGANYFSTSEYIPSSKNKYENVFGFFTKTNNKPTLLPLGKTWVLLSKTLGLGKGTSTIVKVEPKDDKTLGFINSDYDKGIVVINDTANIQTKIISLHGFSDSKITASLYRASEREDGTNTICYKTISPNEGEIKLGLQIPANTVQGIIFKPYKVTARNLLNVLGISTQADCVININENTN